MVKYLVINATKQLNYFPARHGVSHYYSPHMIVHQTGLDYHKHCHYAFGTYVQASNEPHPTNTNAPRTLDCIYLGYTTNLQGGYECLHLPTNRVITRSKVTPLPITPGVILAVTAIARRENMPEGLKLNNRYGITLYDLTWRAGVEFQDENYENDNESNTDSDNESDTDSDDDDNDNDDEDDEDDEDNNETNENMNDDYDRMNENYEDLDVLEGVQEWNAPIQQQQQQQQRQQQQQQQQPEQQDDIQIGQDVMDPPTLIEQNEEENDDPMEEVQQAIQPEQQHQANRTRSGREVQPPSRFGDYHMHLQTEDHPESRTREYTTEEGKVIATIMQYFEFLNNDTSTTKAKAKQFVQTYSLKTGLKKFGKKDKESSMKEMTQLEQREVYYPIHVSDLTPLERKRAMESLIFLTEKRDGTIKTIFCANGSTQREYMNREESASPTVMTESILITSVIDAKQKRDVMTCDIPNAFCQTDMVKTKKGERVIMKIRGALVGILIEMDHQKYAQYVSHEAKGDVIYVVMSKALYGMLESSLLYYKKFRNDIEGRGYTVNPYDACVANKDVEDKQHTVCWHVDDLKASHVSTKVNDDFLEWLNEVYGKEGEVKATRGDTHDYLAMWLIFLSSGKVVVDMRYYVKKMIEDFPEKLKDGINIPWTERLF